MFSPFRWLLALTAALAGCAPQPSEKPTLTVSAASDLTGAFREIGAAFERENGVRVEFNFGSSGNLARQIEQGARVDVFASANEQFIDELEHKQLIVPGTKAFYGRGRLVMWQRLDAPTPLLKPADLAQPTVQRIAIANPDHAPYGAAAKQSLESLGLWGQVQDKLVIGENIRQAFQYAETGNVDVGLVALPLCRGSKGRWTLVPENLHRPLDQALAVVAGSPRVDDAIAFAKYVNGPAGRTILRSYGLALHGETLPPELMGHSTSPDAGATPSRQPLAGAPEANP